jgi:hypothetical protein
MLARHRRRLPRPGPGGRDHALTIKPTDDPAVLTVEGDISEPATADRIITEALARFGASTPW